MRYLALFLMLLSLGLFSFGCTPADSGSTDESLIVDEDELVGGDENTEDVDMDADAETSEDPTQ